MLYLLEIGLTIWLCTQYASKGKSWVLGLIPIGIHIGILLCLIFGVLGMMFATGVSSAHFGTMWLTWLIIIAQAIMLYSNAKVAA